MSLDLDKIEAMARAASPGPWRGDRIDGTVKYSLLDAEGHAVIVGNNRGEDDFCGISNYEDECYLLATHPATVLEMIALIRRQEAELIEARERRSEPSAVRVTIVDERRQGLDMVDHRLRQILNPPAPFHGEKWAAADALYWLTGDQAFADQADGLAAESLRGEKA